MLRFMGFFPVRHHPRDDGSDWGDWWWRRHRDDDDDFPRFRHPHRRPWWDG